MKILKATAFLRLKEALGWQSSLILSSLAIILYLTPFFILQENSHIRIHDYLDSHLVWWKVLSESGAIFSNSKTIIPNFANGIPRISFGSEFDLQLWFVRFFGPFQAIVVSQCLMRFVAFWGMRLLLKNHFGVENKIVCNLSALCFSLLPFWPAGGLSVAGQPIVLNSFLNIKNRVFGWQDWLILILVPFYSYFIVSYFFFLSALFVYLIIHLVKTKTVDLTFGFAIFLMTLVFVFVEHRLFEWLIFNSSDLHFHREEFLQHQSSFSQSLKSSFKLFWFGQDHAHSLQMPFIFVALFCAFIFAGEENRKLLIKLVLIAVLICVFHFLWLWIGLGDLFRFLLKNDAISFNRFHFLFPLLWGVCFALSLSVIYKVQKFGKPLVITLIFGQIELLIWFHPELAAMRSQEPNYKAFYASNQFQRIKSLVGFSKVASIGIHPAISQYNGLHTLDHYLLLYPLAYKHQFNEVIEKELNRDALLKKYFDTWGSRCYLYSTDAGAAVMTQKSLSSKIINPQIDTSKLEQMGGRFIISALKIQNASSLNLSLIEVLEDNQSAWKIYLYRLNSSELI